LYLSEEHIISKNHNLWKVCDDLCYKSKNLYNYSLYQINLYRELNDGKLPSGYDLYHIVKNETCFKELPNDTAKQTVFKAVNNWKFFFKALRAWKRNPSSFTGMPEPPMFKHKTKGRFSLSVPIRNCRLIKNNILFNKHIPIKSLETKVPNLVEVLISPQSNCYKIQICYEKVEDAKVVSNNFIAIDLGVNNLATVTNNFSNKSFILNGKPIKSINQFYNKKLASLKSKLPKYLAKDGSIKQRNKSNKTTKLTLKRNNKIKWSLHNYSKEIVSYCISNNVSTIAIGYNEQWKQNVNLGKKTNQKFSYIPFKTFIGQIQYKAELKGISVRLHEESYTSKCSALDLEPICKQVTYAGKRVKRGLFQIKNGKTTLNSDQNGSLNIGRKVFGDNYVTSNIGCVIHPTKVNLCKV
jgi:putative transposase